MSANQEQNQPASEQTPAGAAAISSSEETGEPANPNTKRRSRTAGWIVEALLLGWVVAKSYFAKPPVPHASVVDASPDLAPSLTPAAATWIRVRRRKKTGRAADRNLDPESGSDFLSRRRWGTLFVVCAFVLGTAAGVTFVFAYWTGGSNQLLGGSLAIFLGGFGAALVFYPHWLMAREEATGPREKLPSSTAERDAMWEDCRSSALEVQRRGLLKWIIAAAVGIFGAIFVSLFRSLGRSPYPSLFDTVWKRGQRLLTAEGKPVSVNSLEPGSAVTVFPEGSIGNESAQTVLIRVKEQLLEMPKDRANWAPQGYVAYSRVCTHAGCSVGLFESGRNLLLCPCHQSTFDVLRAAAPTGGPAARALPQLPLYADADGTLRAGGGFSSPPGPGFWGMP